MAVLYGVPVPRFAKQGFFFLFGRMLDAFGVSDKAVLAHVVARFANAGDLAVVENLLPAEVVLDLRQRAAQTENRPDLFARLLAELGYRRERPLCKHLHGVLGEKRFTMALDMSKSPECTYYVREPTPALTEFLTREPFREGTMIDVGANAGYHALTAALTFERVLAFEPTPATARRLERNVALSKLENVTVFEAALSNREGMQTMHVSDHNPGVNALTASHSADNTERQRVKTLRLDDVLDGREEEHIACLKLDVEGHEREVLQGAQKTIRRHRPLIFAETAHQRVGPLLELMGPDYRIFDPERKQELSRARLEHESASSRDLFFSTNSLY